MLHGALRKSHTTFPLGLFSSGFALSFFCDCICVLNVTMFYFSMDRCLGMVLVFNIEYIEGLGSAINCIVNTWWGLSRGYCMVKAKTENRFYVHIQEYAAPVYYKVPWCFKCSCAFNFTATSNSLTVMEILLSTSHKVFAYTGMKVYVLSHSTVPWRNVFTCLSSQCNEPCISPTFEELFLNKGELCLPISVVTWFTSNLSQTFYYFLRKVEMLFSVNKKCWHSAVL